MSLDVGFDAQVPSLPDAGAMTSSLGETFSTEPSTGTADFSIRIDTPNGPNDIGPRLVLRYDSSAGNGPFGLGFNLRLPRILVSIAYGFPRYDRGDRLMLEGAGELLALGDGTLQPIVDGAAWRVATEGDGFRLTDRDGVIYMLGTSPSARLFDVASNSSGAAGATFAWHLERIEDALGNIVEFAWERDANQLYLARVAYGSYLIRFDYAARPDTLRWGRAGFLIATRRRCVQIELSLPREPQPVLRRWHLAYTQHELNGSSLLSSVMMTGIDAAGNALDAPPLSLGYSTAAARTLTRMRAVDDGASPGPLQRTGRRNELIDWFGSGLPDLLEISGGGRARVWPNVGGLTWGRPQTVGTLPLFSEPDAEVAFIDMNGDGLADLVRSDRPLSSYVPRNRDGFDRPVTWSHAPATPPVDAAARLIDADGDGIADLLVSNGDTLAIHYRTDPEGWLPVPQIVPRSEVPAAQLHDRHVFLADMTGSGSRDLVRVDGGGVTYWPALGHGRWAEAVEMATPPVLPFDFEPNRVFLQDIDGDGCADLVYLDQGRLLYWMNQAGCGFSDMHAIDFLPIAEMAESRFADMSGNGVNGLLWSATLTGRVAYFFLDFVGGAKPYLLERIDNGSGLVTTVEYSTSAREAARDRATASPWSSLMPITLPVVSAIERKDQGTGNVSRTEYRYHEGRYDGVLREFAGFGRVECSEIGDETAPTLLQTSWFHNGRERDGGEPRTREDRMALRAIRGRLYRQERSSPDGTLQTGLPFDRLEQNWLAEPLETAAGTVHRPRLAETTRTVLERTPDPVTRHTTTNTGWDADGNVTDSIETTESLIGNLPAGVLRTHCDFAVDPARRFLSLQWRMRQFDASDNVIADSITEYDHAPLGQVGNQGLVTRRLALVLTDALAADVYGDAPPDLASLGYFRRPGEDGWWVTQASYTRVDDAAGLRGTTTDASGATSSYQFDADRTFPVLVMDPMGNVTAATYDARVARAVSVTDPSGTTRTTAYDALARLIAHVDAGDTDAMPTVEFDYVTDSVPLAMARRQRAISGDVLTLVSRDLYDGSGRVIERRESDGDGEVAVMSRRYGARGLVSREWRPFRPVSALYGDPGGALPSTTYSYDALGRVLRVTNPDGSIRTMSYEPLLIVEADEEDTRTDAGATHRDTPTRRRFDATGRVVAVEQNLGGRWFVSEYAYDVKGHVVRHTDEAGNEVRFWFDLLGRQLRMRRPERDVRVVRDAMGRPVESRAVGADSVFREFDPLGRLVALRIGSSQAPPIHELRYHDAGRPATPDAGAHTRGGRLVRVDDETGSTVFDYDARGRQVHRRWQPTGSDLSYVLDAEFRADGRVAAITYPDGGSGRRRLEHVYDVRGRLVAIPTVVPEIDVDIGGLVTRMRYANGTELVVDHDDAMGRMLSRTLTSPAGWRQATAYTWDRVGNLIAINSDDDKLAAVYTYDDLYRLTGAAAPLDEHYEYRYTDNGVLAFKSDVGEYRYGEGGAAPTCLTTAGSFSLGYAPTGEITSAPWGDQTFDALGRLRGITRDGTTLAQYVYDWNGRRVVSTTFDAQGASISRLTPDALFSIEAGTLVLNFFARDQIVARQSAAGETTFLHLDHLGSVIAASDQAGRLVDSLRYDPFGRLIERTGSVPVQPLGFTGGEYDAASGLLYLQARYYHPALGIFISVDPIVQDPMTPIAWAAYTYCGNNPTTRVDPTGMWSELIGKLIAGAVAVVALTALIVVTSGAFAPEVATASLVGAEPTAGSTFVAIGAVTGGLIGGMTLIKEEGIDKFDIGDMMLAIALGAAVSGWATYATVYGPVGPGKVAGEGIAGKLIPVLSGPLNNAITQSAFGFAHAIAKPIAGHGKTCDFLQDMAQSFISGYVSGAMQSVFLTAFTPKLDVRYEPWRNIATAASIVGVEQAATSQIEWHHKFGSGLLENIGIGGLLDMAAAMGGFYVLGGWGISQQGLWTAPKAPPPPL
jgi:RHS repeat-associated protein